MKTSALTVLLVALALAAGCRPVADDTARAEARPAPVGSRWSAPQFLDYAPLENEGPFVEWPAQAGAFALGVPAAAAAMYARAGDPVGASQAFGYIGYFAVGGPCWVLKKTLWDFPRSLFLAEKR